MKIDMHFHEKRKLGRKTRLWGDTSAFSLMTRIPILDEILETFPPEWLVRTRNVRLRNSLFMAVFLNGETFARKRNAEAGFS